MRRREKRLIKALALFAVGAVAWALVRIGRGR